jgi:hypothetical protein
MTTATHITAWLAAAALLAGCAGSGPSKTERAGPTVAAPKTDPAPTRETATISPTSANPSTATPPPTSAPATTTETRHQIPTDTTAKSVYDKEWEYRLYRYLPVNERGQAELGLLKSKMRADGWELYSVTVAPVGHSTAIFRRHRKTSVLTNTLPTAPGAGNAAGGTGTSTSAPRTGASGAGTPEPPGSPSSLPPAPGR